MWWRRATSSVGVAGRDDVGDGPDLRFRRRRHGGGGGAGGGGDGDSRRRRRRHRRRRREIRRRANAGLYTRTDQLSVVPRQAPGAAVAAAAAGRRRPDRSDVMSLSDL